MNNKNETKAQQKRRFLLVLPLLLVPFVTIAFSFIQENKPAAAGAIKLDARLNTDLPGVNVRDRPMDKLSYYDLAKADSLKLSEQMKKDPYYQQELQLAQQGQQMQQMQQPGLNVYGETGYNNRHETMVFDKISSLNAALNQNQQQGPGRGALNAGFDTRELYGNARQPGTGEDIDRLEKMMQMMNKGVEGGQDPELQELNGMLEKLMDIQHPERVKEKLRKNSAESKGLVFTVSAGAPEDVISVLDQESKGIGKLAGGNGFYAFEDIPDAQTAAANIKAVVHETQVVVNGSIVKMRLVNDLFINGVLIPKDNFVFGTAALNGERLSIAIDNIRFGNSLFPVKLTVYDMDGLDGIHIPGAISRDVAKQSGSNALQGFGMSTMDQSLGMQAASAGIELTKNLVGKRVKLVKVTIKAGYQVLFKDENQRDDK